MTHLRNAIPSVSQAVRIGPHAGAHRAALRVAVSMAVPFSAVYCAGRMDLAGYVVLGAFASIFGRDAARRPRIKMQSVVGGSLVLSVGLGVWMSTWSDQTWLTVLTAAGWAALVTFAGQLRTWRPVGPLFQLIALTVCAVTPDLRGADLPLALMVSALSAAFAVLVGVVGGINEPRFTAAPPTTIPYLARDRWPAAGSAAIGYFVAVALAGGASTILELGHGYWAMITAVVPLAAMDTPGRLLRAGHRVVGTVLGLGIAALLLSANPSGLIAVVIIVVLQSSTELLIARHYGLALVLITPLALVMAHLVDPQPASVLIRDRAVQTLIGVAAALTVIAFSHVLMGYLRRTRAAS